MEARDDSAKEPSATTAELVSSLKKREAPVDRVVEWRED